jgi:catechol 2,3-dioxygenase-like lactoylglutathione lyase family enzyme
MLSDHPVFPILLSTDLAASRGFYRDTLGLEILAEDEGASSSAAAAKRS